MTASRKPVTTAVLLMAYGSPRSPEEVAPYLREVRGGRPVSAQAVADLTERYRRIGSPSPLPAITQRQAAGLHRALASRGDYFVRVGMKHWHPFIRDAVERVVAEGAGRIVGIAAAPHHSRMSIGGYEARMREALGGTIPSSMVHDWYRQPAFVRLVARNLRAALDGWDPADRATRVIFTAHSLPERILDEGDPYRDQVLDSARLVAAAARIPNFEFAFQSAAVTGEAWLGPDVEARLRAFAASGGRRVVVAPIGFVADHLEVLYDVDIACARTAAEAGLGLRRIASPNDDPLLVEALARAVIEAPETTVRDAASQSGAQVRDAMS